MRHARRRPGRERLLNQYRSESGVAFVFALLGLAVLTVLGIGLTSLGMLAATSAANERDTAEALAIADAGLAHARKLILWQEWESLDQFLQNGAGTACDGDELVGPPTSLLRAGYPTAAGEFVPAAGRVFGRGQYRVLVCDDEATDVDTTTGILDANPNVDVNTRILVRSAGTGANGATATVEMVIGAQELPAIIVNGSLSVPGSPLFQGTGGAAHANGSIVLEGDPCASEYYSAVGTVTVLGNSVGTGSGCSIVDLDTRPDSPPLNVRVLNPDSYKAMADFWLESNGRIVLTGSPTVTFNGGGIVGTRAIGWRECRSGTDPSNPCGPLWGG